MPLDPGWTQTPQGLTPIATPSGFLARGDRLLLACDNPACLHDRQADLQAMVARGWGDAPISAIRARLKCSVCGGRNGHGARTVWLQALGVSG